MRAQVLIAAACLLMTSCRDNGSSRTQKDSSQMDREIPGKVVTLDGITAMYSNIAENTEWDMSGEMLWGYFFTHHEPKRLEEARDELVQRGYRFVEIYQSDRNDQDDPLIWWLHVEKEEVHTPQSLDARNDELYLFAHEHGLDSCDGMDVGPMAK